MQFPRCAVKLACTIDGFIITLMKPYFYNQRENISHPFWIGAGLIALNLPLCLLFLYDPGLLQNKIDEIHKNSKSRQRFETDCSTAGYQSPDQTSAKITVHIESSNQTVILKKMASSPSRSASNSQSEGDIEMTYAGSGYHLKVKKNLSPDNGKHNNSVSLLKTLSNLTNITSSEDDSDQTGNEKTTTDGEVKNNEHDTKNPFVFLFHKAKSLPATYWMIIAIFLFMDAAVSEFSTVLPQFLKSIYKTNGEMLQNASIVRQVPGIVAFFSPLCGKLVDASKHKRYWLLFAGAIGMCSSHVFNMTFAMFGASHWSFIYPILILLGTSQVFVGCVLTPAIAFIVDHQSLGVAYGILTSVSSISGFVIPQLINKNMSTDTACICFVSLSLFMVVMVCIFLWFFNGASQLSPSEKQSTCVLRDEANKMDDDTAAKTIRARITSSQQRHKLPIMETKHSHKSTYYILRYG